MQESVLKIGIVGGGAAGFFCAINAAEIAKQKNIPCQVIIFESSHQFLKKVRISGGGRCNVTHNIFEVQKFCENYPRGRKELLSPMQSFQAADTIEWFKARGVEIVAELDGRMFPKSNSSETIIETYQNLCDQFNIERIPKSTIRQIALEKDGGFSLVFKNETRNFFHKVLIATGSSESGYQLAQSLGHTITERAPSLFSFKIQDPLLEGLQGLSFPNTSLTLKVGKTKFKQQGPSLITHWGLSGPAPLKLSAWAAREMNNSGHQARLLINWIGLTTNEVEEDLNKLKTENAKALIKNTSFHNLPKRFWTQLLDCIKIDGEKQWANISKSELNKILSRLTQSDLEIHGKNRFKDEFVECGGVSSKEIDFKTMQSKRHPGLYFAGEILDVDGITGGFNFQNAWTTAITAARSMTHSSTVGG